MGQFIRFGIILGAICLVATMVLAAVYEVTKPRIEEEIRKEREAALREVMPGADSFREARAGDIEYFEAMRAGALEGYCLKLSGRGYGGRIVIIAGVDTDGVVKGVRILEHQETPGLGSKIKEVRPGEKEAWFLKQFEGKKASSLKLKKNVDTITGATISSRAVTDAVRDGAEGLFNAMGK